MREIREAERGTKGKQNGELKKIKYKYFIYISVKGCKIPLTCGIITLNLRIFILKRFLKGGNIVKRILAIILLVITAVVPTVAVSAYSSEDTAQLGAKAFTPRLTAPSKSNAYYYSSKNILYASGYGMPNCTAYAWGRAYEILGKKPNLCANDANNWYGYNKYYKYYPYGKTPKVGAIACWQNSYGGHVAVVEKIEGNTVTLSHSEWGGRTFFLTTHKLGASNGGAVSYGWTFQGYIYVYNGNTQETLPDGDVYRVNSSDGINMRKGAGTSYSVVSVLLNGEEFVVKETKKADGYTWGKTTCDGVTGWCALDFCKLVYKRPAETKPTEPATTVPLTTAPPTEPETTVPATTLPEDKPEATEPSLPLLTSPAGWGDVTGDGKVTIADVTYIQKFLAGLGLNLNEITADVTGDGRVTVADATYIQKVLAGIVTLQ